jgi:hypothetical protein
MNVPMQSLDMAGPPGSSPPAGGALPPPASPDRRRRCLTHLGRGFLFFNFLPMILVAVLSSFGLMLAFGLAAAVPVISFLASIPMYRAGVFQVGGCCSS